MIVDLERVGSGLISLLKAIDLGLVYDLTKIKYVLFMKGKGEEDFKSKWYGVQSIQPRDFNYPSSELHFRGQIRR